MTQTNVEEDDPWLIILSEAAFAIISTTNRLKGYSPGHLVFRRNMIIPIKHKVDWEIIHQQIQMLINKYIINENMKRVDHDYKSEIKLCSLITLHKNMKHHITGYLW